MRILGVVAFVFGSMVAMGCSSATPIDSSGQSSAVDGDGGSCNIVAAGYDQNCTQDSDCVAVPTGGNTCDPCQAGSGDFDCKLAVVSATDSARYTSDLSNALQGYQGTSTYQQCVINSCPAFTMIPACVNNKCQATNGSAGVDAGH